MSDLQEPISVEEYADQIAAGWPPLSEEGRAKLSRVLVPVVRAVAEKKQAKVPAASRSPRRKAAA